jgi:hypothetical protein
MAANRAAMGRFGHRILTNQSMESALDNKKSFIILEGLIGIVFILCYWVFEVGMILSLVACLPIAVFSVYVLVSAPKGDETKTD